jgi:hypothetical protein
MGSLHLLLLLPAWLLPDRTGAMPADNLLQAGLVSARRTAADHLHAVRAGGSSLPGSLHLLLPGSLHGDEARSVYRLPYGTAGLPPTDSLHDLHNGPAVLHATSSVHLLPDRRTVLHATHSLYHLPNG